MVKGIVVAALLILVAAGSFYGGNYQGKAAGYSNGYAKAQQERPPVNLSRFVLSSEYDSLREDHNKLINDYNALVKYANTPQYQPRQPISCTSYNYGFSSTSTTCY